MPARAITRRTLLKSAALTPVALAAGRMAPAAAHDGGAHLTGTIAVGKDEVVRLSAFVHLIDQIPETPCGIVFRLVREDGTTLHKRKAEVYPDTGSFLDFDPSAIKGLPEEPLRVHGLVLFESGAPVGSSLQIYDRATGNTRASAQPAGPRSPVHHGSVGIAHGQVLRFSLFNHAIDQGVIPRVALVGLDGKVLMEREVQLGPGAGGYADFDPGPLSPGERLEVHADFHVPPKARVGGTLELVDPNGAPVLLPVTPCNIVEDHPAQG